MASGADTHTHTHIHTRIHPHRSDFKKPGVRRPARRAPGLTIPANYPFKYGFKRNSPLPLPNGPLSREIPVAAISATNDEVTKALQVGEDDSGKCMKRRGPYQKYIDKEKAEIGKYAMMHGGTASLRHFKDRYSELKYTTICEWKKAIATEEKKSQQPVTELKSKKRGRPSMLPDKITTLLMKYIHTIRDAGGIINTAIVIAAGLGIVKKIDPGLLECNGGHVVLQKSWAKYLLNKMDFVKRKATTKKPKFMVSNFEELKDQFLMDIKAIASMEDIPNDMIVNWDQTAINIFHCLTGLWPKRDPSE